MTDEELGDLIRRCHLQVRLLLAGAGVPASAIDEETCAVFRRYQRTCDRKPADITDEKWLRGIVRRRLQRRTGEADRLATLLSSEKASTLERVEDGTLRRRLRDGLAALSRRKGLVLRARYLDGGDLITAATHLDDDEGATANLLLRLRSSLRDLCTGKAELGSARPNAVDGAGTA